jgi:hypothetical protein
MWVLFLECGVTAEESWVFRMHSIMLRRLAFETTRHGDDKTAGQSDGVEGLKASIFCREITSSPGAANSF